MTYFWSTSTTCLLHYSLVALKGSGRDHLQVASKKRKAPFVGEWPRIACNLGIFLDRQSICEADRRWGKARVTTASEGVGEGEGKERQD